MPELRTQIEEVRAELMNGDPRRALAVCEDILGRYPKHLEAYCLSAEALRELGESKTARERFLRVLSADPENVIAYWGLSIIFEQENRIEAAIWGIDTALAVTPGHRELAQEYVRLTGEAPSLTRAGLSRIRFRGGHYDQAVREAQAVLAEEPNRLDTRVLLAEALWRLGRLDEARHVCEALLSDSPDCLKANLILGQCLLQGPSHDGQYQEGLRLLRRALALDPEARVASELFDGGPLPNALGALLAQLPTPPGSELASADDGSSSPDGASGDVQGSGEDDRQPAVAEPPITTAERDLGVLGDDFEPLPDDNVDLVPASERSDEPIGSEPPPAVEEEPAAERPRSEPEPAVALWLADHVEEVALGSTVGVSQAGLAFSARRNTSSDDAGSNAGDLSLDPTLDPRWAELLTMDASLDAETEARLNAALAEMGFDPTLASSATSNVVATPYSSVANEEGWREVFTGNSGLFAALESSSPSDTTESPVQSPAEGQPLGGETGETDAPALHVEATTSDVGEVPTDTSEPTDSGRQTGPAETPTQRPRLEPLLRSVPDHTPIAVDHRVQLEAAFAYQEEGNLDAAVTEYAHLIRVAPDLLDEVIENLKSIVRKAPEHAAAHRALGDAYMRSGRFQEAIDQYNWVLGQPRAGAANNDVNA